MKLIKLLSEIPFACSLSLFGFSIIHLVLYYIRGKFDYFVMGIIEFFLSLFLIILKDIKLEGLLEEEKKK